MSGLRIHHPTLRNCVLIVPHPGDPRTGRRSKNYEIHIDNEGDAIVSNTVWGRLMEARQSGLSKHDFILMNTVLHPPTQGIGINTGVFETERKKIYKQILDVAQEFAPDGIVPRITKRDN